MSDPIDCSLPGFSVHRIFQARTVEWAAISSSRGSSQPRNQTRVSCIADWVPMHRFLEEVVFELYVQKWKESEIAQSCPTLCDPMDCSLSGSSVHGIFQARVLEWIAISLSRGSSQPRNQTRVSRIAGRRLTVYATREACAKALHYRGSPGNRKIESPK